MRISSYVLKRLLIGSFVACSSIAGLGIGGLGSVAQAEPKLTIGSVAPELNIEHWVTDGKGAFKPVTKFENGKIYIVEFWATWCGPCIMSMPHLAELQKKYADKGVHLISVSDEDLDTVNEFLDQHLEEGFVKEDAKDAPKTFRELTNAYSLTTDPDGSVSETYMGAAELSTIPHAFIVGKDQKIEWIGHPATMDEVLAEVVEGKWDRDAFLVKYNTQKQVEGIFSKITVAMRGNKFDEALKSIDEAIDKLAKAKITDFDGPLQITRYQVLMSDKKFAAQQSAAFDKVLKIAENSPEEVNGLAWIIYEAAENETVTDKALIKKARVAAEAAAAKLEVGDQPDVLDTVAHLLYKEGDVAGALKVQQKAVELVEEDLKEDFVEFIDFLKGELK